MYGFLRIRNSLLNQSDRESYRHLYCGQCGAVQKYFGYPWRALVSYDAAFMGLLIAAQQDADFLTTKSWCGVFPKKMTVCSPNDLSSVFSACMAVIIFSLKIADARQEGRPYWKGWLEKRCSLGFQKARDILSSMDFPTELFETVSAEQQRLESARRRDIVAYAEPSARFLAEVFRFTSIITGNHGNEDVLYEIGYHVGRIVYLVDSCIDILDDIEKREFNALMAAYANYRNSVSSDARTEITQMVMDSLRWIRTSVKALHLKRHQSIIGNILLEGFPATIQSLVQRSVKKLEKDSPLLLKYLPHTALASALCLVTAQNADAAGWVWGKNYGWNQNDPVYGFTCCEPNECYGICNWCDCLLNPCICYTTTSLTFLNCFYLVCQMPKMAITGRFIWIGIQVLEKRGEERRKRFEQEDEERRRREAAEMEERQRRVVAELKQRNQEYIDKALSEINSIESFFKTYPLDMGKKVIPQNFKDEIFNFIGNHRNEDLSANKELKKLIADKTEILRQLNSRFEDAMQVHKYALDIYESVKNAVSTSGNIAITKELEFDYAELTSTNVKGLLADQRWDDFKEVVKAIETDMIRLQEAMKGKSAPKYS